MVKIVEHILEFNQLNQSGQGLKILSPSQMLNRLPIALAQLNAGNNCILCTDQKNLENTSIKVWLTLF